MERSPKYNRNIHPPLLSHGNPEKYSLNSSEKKFIRYYNDLSVDEIGIAERAIELLRETKRISIGVSGYFYSDNDEPPILAVYTENVDQIDLFESLMQTCREYTYEEDLDVFLSRQIGFWELPQD